MIKAIFTSLGFLLFALPLTASAEDLLPALCKQIITPDNSTSLPQVIVNNITERIKEIPHLVMQDLRSKADDVANSLADTLEAKKVLAYSPGLIASTQEPQTKVLGTSTKNVSQPSLLDRIWNWILDALSFLLRHWLWTLAGLGAFAIGLMMRF